MSRAIHTSAGNLWLRAVSSARRALTRAGLGTTKSLLEMFSKFRINWICGASQVNLAWQRAPKIAQTSERQKWLLRRCTCDRKSYLLSRASVGFREVDRRIDAPMYSAGDDWKAAGAGAGTDASSWPSGSSENLGFLRTCRGSEGVVCDGPEERRRERGVGRPLGRPSNVALFEDLVWSPACSSVVGVVGSSSSSVDCSEGRLVLLWA